MWNIILSSIFIFYALSLKSQDSIPINKPKPKSSRNLRLGFNLDWHFGNTWLQSKAPLEFMGWSPIPEVFGGSFDFLYKNDWLLNFAFKYRYNYHRQIFVFDAGPIAPNANKRGNGYEARILKSIGNQTHYGLSLNKKFLQTKYFSHYLGFGIGVNTVSDFPERSGISFYEQPGSLTYAVTADYSVTPSVLENKFFPRLYNPSATRPVIGWILKDVGNELQYYAVSYKLMYTGYYNIAKGKMQLLFGCGFEYQPLAIYTVKYTLYSKYDNINTSGTFKYYNTNAFIKIGIRFGRMGVKLGIPKHE